MSRNKVGQAWRKVKAWLMARLYPAVVLEVVPIPPGLTCRICVKPIDKLDELFVWNSLDYHKSCLYRERGWDVDAEPRKVLPNLSIHRFDAERAVWPDAPAGARLD